MTRTNKPSRSDDVTATTNQVVGTEVDFRQLQESVEANSKAIEGLKTMPDKLEELKNMIVNLQPAQQYFEFPDEENWENGRGSPVSMDLENDSTSYMAQNLLKTVDPGPEGTKSDEVDDPELLQILEATAIKPIYGAPLQKDVADSFARLCAKRATKEETEKWKDQYKIPENCKNLGTPRINSEIWMTLGRGKLKDLEFKQFQDLVSLSTVCYARIAEKIIEMPSSIDKKSKQDLLQLVLEGATISCAAMTEISLRRRVECKPYLPKEVVGICASTNPITENLFGDNAVELIKTCKSTASLLKPSSSKNNRYRPYVPRQATRTVSGNGQRSYRYPPKGAPRPFQRGNYYRRPQPPRQGTSVDNQ